MFVNVYFKTCLCLGNGLADMNVFVCVNVPNVRAFCPIYAPHGGLFKGL